MRLPIHQRKGSATLRKHTSTRGVLANHIIHFSHSWRTWPTGRVRPELHGGCLTLWRRHLAGSGVRESPSIVSRTWRITGIRRNKLIRCLQSDRRTYEEAVATGRMSEELSSFPALNESSRIPLPLSG